MSELKQIVLSVFSGVVSSFIYSIILVFFGFLSNGNDVSINSFLKILINNWFVLLLIFLVIAGIIYQRFRMIEKCYIQEYQSDFPVVERKSICSSNLVWRVIIQDNNHAINSPYFTYNLIGPFCSNMFEDDVCLTPLKIKNRFLFYELKCPSCNKRYFKFKSLTCYKKDIELKIYPYLIKNKISTSEHFIKFIKNNRHF